jgi:hypothetical protein
VQWPAQARRQRIAERSKKHDYWEAVACVLDGDIVTGALTHLDSSLAAILIKSDDVTLRLSGHWDLDPGDLARIRIVVDDSVYRGRARAINDSEYEIQNLSLKFVKAMIDARTAVIHIGRARWTLTLYGVTASLKQAIEFKEHVVKEYQKR